MLVVNCWNVVQGFQKLTGNDVEVACILTMLWSLFDLLLISAVI